MTRASWSHLTTPWCVLVLLGGAILHPVRGEAQALPDHGEFTRILSRVVDVPLVDYQTLVRERSTLDRYLSSLATTSEAELEAASREEQLAFWINAYNACMLRRVADHYPLTEHRPGWIWTVRNRIAGYPDNSVWRIRHVFTEPFCTVAGGARSLDDIEHGIIRPRFDEPRIHFAVNCAARSCPPLIPEAYRAEELDRQLDEAVRRLTSHPDHFQLEAGSPPTLRLNKVLEWYAEDFGGIERLADFFRGYVGATEARLLTDPALRVEFFEYDWTLNDLSR